jgi:hypothetical protein
MNLDIDFAYAPDLHNLPTASEHFVILWKVALLLDTVGMPLADWSPPADTPEDARRNQAFDRDGPTPAALAIVEEEERSDPANGFRYLGIWNGYKEEGGSSVLLGLKQADGPGNCTFRLQAQAVPSLSSKANLIKVLTGLSLQWQPPFIVVDPGNYGTRQKVFADRPGAGWLLYLPGRITRAQVPEAAELLPVLNEDGQQRGTIIVSVAGDAFDDENPAHIQVANAIEIRLADQDLLPRYRALSSASTP